MKLNSRRDFHCSAEVLADIALLRVKLMMPWPARRWSGKMAVPMRRRSSLRSRQGAPPHRAAQQDLLADLPLAVRLLRAVATLSVMLQAAAQKR